MPDLPAIETSVRADLGAWLDDLRTLTAIDSGSYTPSGVDRVLDELEARMSADGWSLERRPCGPTPDGHALGGLLTGRVDGDGSGSILLVGHADTVFPEGTAAARPLRSEGSRVFGPGVCDMKGSLLLALAAVRELRGTGAATFHRITFLVNPDEEIGSPGSRPTILEEAVRHDVAFVLEAARETGALVSARKGVTTGRARLVGRSAHAGVEPERGRSAVLAGANLVVALHALNDRWEGATVNVGSLRGGTRANVVPEEAQLEFELRATSAADQDAAEHEIARLASAPAVEGVEVEVDLRRECPPMERTEATARLVRLAQAVAGDLGFTVEDAGTGGASDANAISALGVPTLDGLGPVGGDDHSDREWIDIDSVPTRAALLAGLIAHVGRRDAEGSTSAPLGDRRPRT